MLERLRLGPPKFSPISDLDRDQLRKSRFRIPGIHTPYGYMSGENGVFAFHVDDSKLAAINILYRGRKVFFVMPPAQISYVEDKFWEDRCHAYTSAFLLVSTMVSVPPLVLVLSVPVPEGWWCQYQAGYDIRALVHRL